MKPLQGLILAMLDPEQPASMIHLATTLAWSPSRLTGTVDGLEARGFVVRSAATHDRRIKLLTITTSGRRLRDEALVWIARTL